jgi:predicted Rossmann-fold nucleotide-binding protein
MEVWTQNQLGEFDKPAGLLDSGGFYQPLLAFVDQMIAAKFLPATHKQSIEVDGDAAVLLEKLRRHRRVETPKWL